MIPATDQIGVSITTKDRWDDLEITLARLRDEGLDRLETIVIDDGSAVPLPARFEQQFPWVRFIRSETSRGCIVQRNRMARLLSTPFILGLDDDSFPIAGSLEAAVNWMVEHPAVAVLALSIHFQNQPFPADFVTREPFPLRDFIACANLMNRELFLVLGGYEERFEFFVEETEFSLRALQQGYETHAYPGVVVQHNLTPVARNNARRMRQYLRNDMLLALWFFPFPECYLQPLRALPGNLIKNPERRKYARSLTLGYLEAPIRYLSWRKKRTRLTHQQFERWKKLPIAAGTIMEAKRVWLT